MKGYCTQNLKTFLEETSLHGLKFVAHTSITIWERLFFLCSFIAAFVVTANLIVNIYAKWNSTPVIIGISPRATSIFHIPFPAITICNMNQVLASKAKNYKSYTNEATILKMLCLTEEEFDKTVEHVSDNRNNNLTITDFVIQNAQPCSNLMMFCRASSVVHNCSDLFREIITDEGMCCVFNVLHPKFLYKGSIIRDFTRHDGRIAVNWNPETGYPENLPDRYYPRPATGTGVLMGLTLLLNAEVDEYYCSSTNGPGFKVAIHNPIETPQIKESGFTIPIGYETRIRIDAKGSETVPSLRSIDRKARQCLFNDEEKLIYFKYYTRSNCESECQAQFFYDQCKCIPYRLPLIYNFSKVCNTQDISCANRAEQALVESNKNYCLDRCLPSCFDLSYKYSAFPIPLGMENFTTPNDLFKNIPKRFVKKNLAIVHFYYRESIFYGNLKNVYIGLTEFLSNTGGIMGLFMGFSFISVAEIFYFTFLKPFFQIILPKTKTNFIKDHVTSKQTRRKIETTNIQNK